MITKVAEWSSILSFAYLVVASIWSEKFDMNINLIFNIVMFLILLTGQQYRQHSAFVR